MASDGGVRVCPNDCVGVSEILDSIEDDGDCWLFAVEVLEVYAPDKLSRWQKKDNFNCCSVPCWGGGGRGEGFVMFFVFVCGQYGPYQAYEHC